MTNTDTPVADPRAAIAELIRMIIVTRRLTQAQASRLAGVSQPEISRLMNDDLREVSLEKMMRTARRLGCDLEIRIRPPLMMQAEVEEGAMRLVVGSWNREGAGREAF